MGNIIKRLRYLIPKERSANGHQQFNEGGRDWENMYRDRWSFDKCVRSTHGVNCTGSCSWNIYVKNGLVAWENQVHDYPETSPDMPDFEPRGCPRGASFSWYLYSPHRIKYPYLRGELAELWREARPKFANALEAWQSIANDPSKTKRYKEARGMGGFVRSNWQEVSEIIAASLLHTIQKYGPDRNFGFSVIPAKSMLSYAAGLRFVQLMGGAKLQNSTSFFYFATDQWRSDEIDCANLTAATEPPALPSPRRLQRLGGATRLASQLPDVQQERSKNFRRGKSRGLRRA